MAGKTAAKRRRARPNGRKPTAPVVAGDQLPAALSPYTAAALVFVAAGSVLVLEILAVRLLAPYVGLTLETTTSIIGAALAGIAMGAAIGGYLADRTDTRRLVVVLLLLGGVLTMLTVPVVRWLGPGAQGSGELAALGITFVALVPAAAVLSAVSPAVAHLQLHDLRASGTIVGRLSAWATAGALVGTFGTGFVLVPLMPVSTAVLVVGVVLLLVGIALGTTSRWLSPAAVAGIVVLATVLGAWSASRSSPCVTETHYHCVGIAADPARHGGYNLVLDGDFQSYIDPGDPKHLEYAYTRWIGDAIDADYPAKQPLNGVFVGGGGLTLPRWLNATRPGSHATVLEVDGDLVKFVEDRIDLQTSPQLRVIVGDARVKMLDLPSNSADFVVGDAFSGYTVPWHLTTSEWMDEVKRVLKPGGLYALNVIDLPPLGFLKAETATVKDAFPEVRMVTLDSGNGRPGGGNAVLLASDRPFPKGVRSEAKGATTYDLPTIKWLSSGVEPLRDDYAPVDQLLTVN